MKRDWNLLRWILNECEIADTGYPLVLAQGAQYSSAHCTLEIGDRSYEEVCEHLLLLGDAGLAEVQCLGRTHEGLAGVVIYRLTMARHDFLDASRSEARWKQTMLTVAEKGGGAVTIGVLTQILSALMKQAFDLS
jgi:hypothetical protein